MQAHTTFSRESLPLYSHSLHSMHAASFVSSGERIRLLEKANLSTREYFTEHKIQHGWSGFGKCREIIGKLAQNFPFPMHPSWSVPAPDKAL